MIKGSLKGGIGYLIDKVTLYKQIELNEKNLDRRIFRVRKYPKNVPREEQKTFYIYNLNNVRILYFVESKILKIEGRLINLSEIDNRVSNLDDVMAGIEGIKWHKEKIETETSFYYDVDDNLVYNSGEENYEYNDEYYRQDLDDLIDGINLTINQLIPFYERLDIRTFKVARIEFCFNINTSYVNEYITLFNKLFVKRKLGERYINYALEKKRPLYSSYYVKSKKQFEDNSKTTYTVNFYNKLDQLQYLNKKNREYRNTHYEESKPRVFVVSDKDLSLAVNTLRMEVIAGYHYLKAVSQKNNINSKEKQLKDFLDIDICSNAIKQKYKYFIDNKLYLDFYKYEAAKDKINNSDLEIRKKRTILKALEKASKNNNLSYYERNLLAEQEIHYFIIPKDWSVSILKSPMKALDDKVKDVKQKMEKFKEETDWLEEEGIY